jgi:hypothetical protein
MKAVYRFNSIFLIFWIKGSESKQIKLNDDFDENEFGDRFIREARISREQEARLKFIDSQLEIMKTAASNNASNTQSGTSINFESNMSDTVRFKN